MEFRKTSFEQVPVEVVKTMVNDIRESSSDEAVEPIEGEGTGNETPPVNAATLVDEIQREQNPSRMIELVERLVAIFDEQRMPKATNLRMAMEPKSSRGAQAANSPRNG